MFCNEKRKDGYSAHICRSKEENIEKKRYQVIGHEGGLWKGHILAEQTPKTAYSIEMKIENSLLCSFLAYG
jgi:hypothetical protein